MSILESVKKGDVEGVKREIQRARDDTKGELYSAAHENERAAMCVNAVEPAGGLTPLMLAATELNGKPECMPIVDLLLDSQASVTAVDFSGRTALHWACSADNLVFVRGVGKRTPNLLPFYFQDFNQQTPLKIAAGSKTPLGKEIARQLDILRFKHVGHGETRLAVIGVGAAGAAMFIHLVRGLMERAKADGLGDKFLESHTIDLFDRKANLGMGTAYSPELNSATSLLNIAAAGMSIESGNPSSFVDWIKALEVSGELAGRLGIAASSGLCPPKTNPGGYYPRLVFGQYVSETLRRWIGTAAQAGINVNVWEGYSVKNQSQATPDGKIKLEVAKEGETTSQVVEVTNIYYSTGHWEEDTSSKGGYLKASGTIQFPSTIGMLEERGVLSKPSNIAILGSSLSAIDAIFSILLHPKVGRIEFDKDDNAKYYPEQGSDGFKITCYSRKGLLPRVRPTVQDAKLAFLSSEGFTRGMAWGGSHMSLESLVKALNAELRNHLGSETIDVLGKDGDPFKSTDAKAFPKDPFKFVREDIRRAKVGDAKWYQVIHALFPIVRRAYRQFTPHERETFDGKYASAFLWAFAPMPDRSAKALVAMHDAGVLDVFRTVDEKDNPLPQKDGSLHVKSLDQNDNVKVNDHTYLINTTGLASRFNLDVSPLTQHLKANGQVFFGKDTSIFAADDDSFEILDVNGGHSPARRGVGYFLHAQLWDVQAVPSVVKYGAHVGNIYLDEFVVRFKGVPSAGVQPSKETSKL
jgi:uncharacterized NAD(P)/FAD-binding protein YdhS